MPSHLRKEQEACKARQAKNTRTAVDIAQQISRSLRPPLWQQVESGLIGQLKFWDEKKTKDFGFIRTQDGEEFFCHAEAFRTKCGVKDIVEFDVEQHTKTGAKKAINVCLHKLGESQTATDEIGTIVRWLQPLHASKGWKAIIKGEDGLTYLCMENDFEQEWFPVGDRVRFDVITDALSGDARAVNIRNAKTLYLSECGGHVVKLTGSYGFVSLHAFEKDVHFNYRAITEDSISFHSRIICDVMVEEGGKFTAVNIRPWRPATDTVMKSSSVDEDCASTTSTRAATDL